MIHEALASTYIYNVNILTAVIGTLGQTKRLGQLDRIGFYLLIELYSKLCIMNIQLVTPVKAMGVEGSKPGIQ